MTESTYQEQALQFRCGAENLLGIVARPARLPEHATGVLVVVGGPQYRVGSHRQFTLLARHLAGHGVASLRFDYHGSGDSSGPPALGVGGIEDDLRAAIDAFLLAAPGVRRVVLWGLCGAASASAIYAPGDTRVAGLVMLNPWVRTEEGLAKARLRHYYLGRLADPDFWSRFARGEVALASSLRSFGTNVLRATGMASRPDDEPAARKRPAAVDESLPLPDRVLSSLERGGLPALVILSGEADLTANEFRQVCSASPGWRRWMQAPTVRCEAVEGSNHTFSRTDWRDRVADLTTAWVKAL